MIERNDTPGVDPCPRYPLVMLAALLVLLYGVNLLIPRDLWVQDEARYGEVVREMLRGGDWLVPHLNGYPYPDKPVVYFWLVASLVKLLGHSEVVFRLLSVLATLVAMTGIFQLGRALADSTTGFWAAALFATTWLGLIGGHMIRMDMLVVAAAVYAWLALHHYQQTGRHRALVAFWALSALALALKGPITLLFTVAPGLTWLSVEKGWTGLRSTYPLAGLAALVGLVAIWIMAVAMTGQGNYLDVIWHKQLVGRTVDSWSHKEPVYFYALALPFCLMPWTGLVVQGGRLLVRERPAGWKAVACFTLIPFAGLSLVSGKLFIYLLPLLPGLCIAAALAATRLIARTPISPWLAWPPALFLVATAAAIGWTSWTYLADTRGWSLAVSAGLLVLAGIGVSLWRSSGYRWLWGWAGLAVGVAWLVFGAFAYLINPLFSARAMGMSIAHHVPPETAVGVVNTTRGILNYYAGRTLVEVDRAEAAAWMLAHKEALLIIKTPDVRSVFGEAGIPASCRVHETYVVELKEYHVLAGC